MGFAVDLSHLTKQPIRYIGILVLSGWDNISWLGKFSIGPHWSHDLILPSHWTVAQSNLNVGIILKCLYPNTINKMKLCHTKCMQIGIFEHWIWTNSINEFIKKLKENPWNIFSECCEQTTYLATISCEKIIQQPNTTSHPFAANLQLLLSKYLGNSNI